MIPEMVSVMFVAIVMDPDEGIITGQEIVELPEMLVTATPPLPTICREPVPEIDALFISVIVRHIPFKAPITG